MKVLYPGSFDPITRGHMEIIDKACKMFDEIYVAVMQNPQKKSGMFTYDERVELIREVYKNNPKVKVIMSEGASVDVAINNGCTCILRGLRNLSDFDFEMQLAGINEDISNGAIQTLCLFASSNTSNISSSSVKELFRLGKDISKYVPDYVAEKMKSLEAAK